VTGSAGGPYTITFGGTQANTNVAQITADATFLTSGTLDRTLSFSYDAASQLTAAEDPDSEYAYTYDNLGRMLTTSNSGTSGVPTVVLTSAYNANSSRTSVSATRGGTADFLNTFTYDNLNRMTRVDQTGNGGATVANKRVDFTYNALGQFSTITRQVKPSSTWNEVATSTFTYDTRNRITALDHKKGGTDIANYDWTYDAMDRVLQFSGPDGTSDYTYDKQSQVTAADHSFQTDESYTYNATGNRTNGGYTVGTNNRMTSDGTYNYTYDDEGNRLTRTKISDSSLTEYTWDHRNRLTKVVERAAGAGQPITKQTDYKYDIFNRRISKSYDADGAGSGSAIAHHFFCRSINRVWC
jgi:YD repeat-containing protein